MSGSRGSLGRDQALEFPPRISGRDLYDTADSEEKRAVGAVWAERSGGKCLFAMPTERDFSAVERAMERGTPGSGSAP